MRHCPNEGIKDLACLSALVLKNTQRFCITKDVVHSHLCSSMTTNNFFHFLLQSLHCPLRDKVRKVPSHNPPGLLKLQLMSLFAQPQSTNFIDWNKFYSSHSFTWMNRIKKIQQPFIYAVT